MLRLNLAKCLMIVALVFGVGICFAFGQEEISPVSKTTSSQEPEKKDTFKLKLSPPVIVVKIGEEKEYTVINTPEKEEGKEERVEEQANSSPRD